MQKNVCVCVRTHTCCGVYIEGEGEVRECELSRGEGEDTNLVRGGECKGRTTVVVGGLWVSWVGTYLSTTTFGSRGQV